MRTLTGVAGHRSATPSGVGRAVTLVAILAAALTGCSPAGDGTTTEAAPLGTVSPSGGAGIPPPAPPVPVPAPAPSVAVHDATLGADDARPAPPEPVRLTIPSLGIDMPVQPVGVRDDGQMEVPDDAETVDWYRFGPAPGDSGGTAVLAAHVDSWETGVGPFAHLRHDVVVGTRLTVTAADGAVREYEVVENRMVPKPELPVDVLFRRDGDPRLVLVTCGGRFQRDVGRYTDNIVVTAVPVT